MWKAAKKFVKTDATCQMLASAIVASNKARHHDAVAMAAFCDRVKEAGHDVPNVAYWSFLLVIAIHA